MVILAVVFIAQAVAQPWVGRMISFLAVAVAVVLIVCAGLDRRQRGGPPEQELAGLVKVCRAPAACAASACRLLCKRLSLGALVNIGAFVGFILVVALTYPSPPVWLWFVALVFLVARCLQCGCRRSAAAPGPEEDAEEAQWSAPRARRRVFRPALSAASLRAALDARQSAPGPTPRPRAVAAATPPNSALGGRRASEHLPRERCTVCLEEMNPSACESLVCGHVFHAECIRSWVARPGPVSCPICRTPVPREAKATLAPRQFA